MKIPVGIEIDEQYLKLVAVKPLGPVAKAYDCVVESIIGLSDDQITGIISEVLEKLKLKPKSLMVSVSRNLVTIRNLHLPSQDNQEIIQMIDLNISRIVPYQREEIVFAYKLLGADEMGYAKVLLAIVNSNALRRQLKILEGAGLLIDQISLSSYGVWQAVLHAYRSEITQSDVYLLLDIDTDFTDFIMFSHNHLLFTRSINVGAAAILENEDVGLTKLMGEVKQSMIIFYNEEMNKKPIKVFLAGAAVVSNLLKTIDTELGVSTIAVNPAYLQVPAGQKPSVVPADVSLTGLAELVSKESDQRLHFILPEVQIKKALKERTRDLIILGSFSVYLFSVICASILLRISNQQGYLKSLQRQSAAIKQEMGNLLADLSKIDYVKTFLANRRTPLVALNQLQKVVPDEIFLNLLEIDEQGKVTIRGQALQLSDVFKFVNTLEKSKYCQEVQTKYTRKKKTKEKEVTDFEINFQIAAPSP